MQEQIIVIFCICDEILKTLGIVDDLQSKMTNAGIMTFAIMSSMIYGCNYRIARLVASNYKYFSRMHSHSRLVKRIHKIPEHIWQLVFVSLQVFLRNKDNRCFIVDSFPVKAYENHRSFRAKIFISKEYHGYSATKKTVFFWD